MGQFVKDYEDLVNDLIFIATKNGEYIGGWDDRTDNEECIKRYEKEMIKKCHEYDIEVKDYDYYKNNYSQMNYGDERAFALYEQLEEKIKHLILRDL